MRFFFLLTGVSVCVAAAASSNTVLPVEVLSAAGTRVSGTHYEQPPCAEDERAVRILGVDGDYCAPQCSTADACPEDVPKGVTASPTCALQSPAGEKYCAILCTPSLSLLRGGATSSSECGPMTCEAVPGADGIGVCTYAQDGPNHIIESVAKTE